MFSTTYQRAVEDLTLKNLELSKELQSTKNELDNLKKTTATIAANYDTLLACDPVALSLFHSSDSILGVTRQGVPRLDIKQKKRELKLRREKRKVADALLKSIEETCFKSLIPVPSALVMDIESQSSTGVPLFVVEKLTFPNLANPTSYSMKKHSKPDKPDPEEVIAKLKKENGELRTTLRDVRKRIQATVTAALEDAA